MKGYDEHGTILLPPRDPGNKLPSEILDHYEEQRKKLEEEEKAKAEAAAAELAAQQAAEGGKSLPGIFYMLEQNVELENLIPGK